MNMKHEWYLCINKNIKEGVICINFGSEFHSTLLIVLVKIRAFNFEIFLMLIDHRILWEENTVEMAGGDIYEWPLIIIMPHNLNIIALKHIWSDSNLFWMYALKNKTERGKFQVFRVLYISTNVEIMVEIGIFSIFMQKSWKIAKKQQIWAKVSKKVFFKFAPKRWSKDLFPKRSFFLVFKFFLVIESFLYNKLWKWLFQPAFGLRSTQTLVEIYIIRW